jgi:hypothetical protein
VQLLAGVAPAGPPMVSSSHGPAQQQQHALLGAFALNSSFL